MATICNTLLHNRLPFRIAIYLFEFLFQWCVGVRACAFNVNAFNRFLLPFEWILSFFAVKAFLSQFYVEFSSATEAKTHTQLKCAPNTFKCTDELLRWFHFNNRTICTRLFAVNRKMCTRFAHIPFWHFMYFFLFFLLFLQFPQECHAVKHTVEYY